MGFFNGYSKTPGIVSESKKHITVFEHESLCVHQGKKGLSDSQLSALQAFYGEKGNPYFSLINKGVKFTSYVGVLQVGSLTIEILPKADKEESGAVWRGRLIDMLRAVGVFYIQAPSSSQLRIKPNSILELYFELFSKEVDYLMRRGLIKKYRKHEANSKALVGRLKFSKHLTKNLVHQERFFVRHSTYDTHHEIHRILYQALSLIQQVNQHPHLTSLLGRILLDFPIFSPQRITASTFDRIHYNRKTEIYRNSIEIARLLLLNYHPDVSQGNNHVLALLFDMNSLWERFVYLSLKKEIQKRNLNYTISAQTRKYFWVSQHDNRSTIRPDILIRKDKDNCIVLDTKWKNLYGQKPSISDLRQLFVYLKYCEANKVALVYPGTNDYTISGSYYEETTGHPGDAQCSIINIAVGDTIKNWQAIIWETVEQWMNESKNT